MHDHLMMNAMQQPRALPQPQAMEVDQQYTKALQCLALSLGWLSEHDICSVSTLNRDFLAAARECHLWQPALSKLEEMPCHDHVELSDSEYPSPWVLDAMRVPPRIHGERHCYYSSLPHSRDRAARRAKEPLVLATKGWMDSDDNEKRVNPTTGRLEDCFYRARDTRDITRCDKIWLERDFPIHCNACENVTLNNEREVFDHCASYEHISNAAAAEGEHVPPEFVDPRHDPEYETMTAFHKARVLAEYRTMVVRFLHQPMNEDSRSWMSRYVNNAKRAVSQLYSDETLLGVWSLQEYETALSNCTLERVMEVCVEDFAVKNFLEYGLAGCLEVVLHGWARFAMTALVDSRYTHFVSLVSGWDFY